MSNKFRMTLLSMVALGLFSCSDKLAEETQVPVDNVEEGFVTFKVSNLSSGMRAAAGRDDADGGYNAGDIENEYAIIDEQGANVVFFFQDGKNYGKSFLQAMEASTEPGDHENEKVYSARIRKKFDNKNDLSCVLVLNAKPDELEKLSNLDLEDFLQVKDAGLGIYNNHFTMSNTVYVKNGEVEGPTAIDPGKIKNTWTEAQKDPVTIHVERVAAKFGMTFTKNDESIFDDPDAQIIKFGYDDKDDDQPTGVDDDDDDDANTTPASKKLPTRTTADGVDGSSPWAIRIKGWNVNGTETETYMVKNLDDGEGSVTNMAFGNWENNPTVLWNDESRLRSYWAVDPHYNSGTDVYPEQYREAANVKENIITGDDNAVLHYISYDEIDAEYLYGSYRYAPENTFGNYEALFKENNGDDKTSFEFAGDQYKLTSTHILIAAELLLGDEVDEVEGTPVGDKYCYQGVYWNETAVGEDQKNLIEYMVKNLIDYHGKALYLKTGNESYEKFNLEGATDYFGLTKANIKGGDGRLMLTILKDTKFYTRTVVEGDGEDDEDVYNYYEANLQDAIWEVGTVQHFNEGKMYYYVPIKHLVAVAEAEKATTADAEDIPYRWNTGSFGVVRNHWYKVNVSAINKPGIPVDKPDQPIIPNDEPDEGNYIAYKIVIIPWHVVEQDVEF